MSRAAAPLGAALVLAFAVAAGAVQTPPQEGAGEEILGAPSAIDPAALQETRVTVPEGTPLHADPDRRSGVLLTVDARVELPELDRRGDWVRVRWAGTTGWVLLGENGAAADAAPGPGARLRVPGPDPALLVRVREVLDDPQVRSLGPYDLYTDVGDDRLLAALDRLVRDTRAAYRERYGLDPGEATPEIVVLVERPEAFRELVGEETALASLGAQGHAGFGVAVLQRGGGPVAEVGALLVHELVHLLNRRSLGPVNPPWLEEGLAHALSYGAIRPDGSLRADVLGGKLVVEQGAPGVDGTVRIEVERSGARAALQRQAEALAAGESMPLQTLTELTWQELSHPDFRGRLYRRTAFFVRYLLDDPERARAFRRYLGGVSEGGPAGGEALLRALGTNWRELEAEFDAWLRRLQLIEEWRLGG